MKKDNELAWMAFRLNDGSTFIGKAEGCFVHIDSVDGGKRRDLMISVNLQPLWIGSGEPPPDEAHKILKMVLDDLRGLQKKQKKLNKEKR